MESRNVSAMQESEARCRHRVCLTAFIWRSRRISICGVGLEGVQMCLRKHSVFVYSYSGLMDVKLAMVGMPSAESV